MALIAAAIIGVIGTAAGIVANKVMADKQAAEIESNNTEAQIDLNAANEQAKTYENEKKLAQQGAAARAYVANQVINTRNSYKLAHERQMLDLDRVNNRIPPSQTYHRGSPAVV